jgi:hypothetical protein
MRRFFGAMTGEDYARALDELAGGLEALPNARTFRVTGDAHPLLLHPAAHAAGDTGLLQWLAPLATGTGDFASAGP